MQRRPVALMLCLILAALTNAGCRSQRLIADQSTFRSQLLDLYTDQLMDNLIRARKGLPIIHVDYTNITGSTTDTGNAGFTVNFPKNDGNYTGGGSLQSQLTVTGNSVIANADVYNAYLSFVNIPDGLMETCDPPPPGAAHIVKCVEGNYFWVPVTYRKEFFELSLRTITRVEIPETDNRTKVRTTIKDIRPLPDNPKLPASHGLVLVLEPQVPNDNGIFKVQLPDGVTYVLKVGPVSDPLPVDYQSAKDGTINMLELNYVEELAGAKVLRVPTVPLSPQQLGDQLKGKTIEIIYSTAQSPTSKSETLLQSIFHQDQLLRLNTLGRGRP